MLRLTLVVWSVFNLADSTTVTIQPFGCMSDSSCPCDKNVTLMCTINPYDDLVIWYLGDKTIFQCSLHGCASYDKEYTFDYDITAGIFNLTLNPLTLDANLVDFKCDTGGSGSSTKNYKVIVNLQDNEFNTGFVHTNDGKKQIYVNTTRCVYLKNVKFLWKASTTQALQDPVLYEETFNDAPNYIYINCSKLNNKNCGGNATSKIVSSITIPDNEGDTYYLFVDVQQDGVENITIQIPGLFKLKTQGDIPDRTTHFINTDTTSTREGDIPDRTTHSINTDTHSTGEEPSSDCWCLEHRNVYLVIIFVCLAGLCIAIVVGIVVCSFSNRPISVPS